MLNYLFDKQKSRSQLIKDSEKICSIEDCGNPLTTMKGPGSNVLCRDHQIMQREYGGVGRIDRPYTFHRKSSCSECGYNPWEDTTNKYYYLKDVDPELWFRICRNKMIGDHQIRRADGGNNSAGNIKTYCLNCNSDKTIVYKDYMPAKINIDNIL